MWCCFWGVGPQGCSVNHYIYLPGDSQEPNTVIWGGGSVQVLPSTDVYRFRQKKQKTQLPPSPRISVQTSFALIVANGNEGKRHRKQENGRTKPLVERRLAQCCVCDHKVEKAAGHSQVCDIRHNSEKGPNVQPSGQMRPHAQTAPGVNIHSDICAVCNLHRPSVADWHFHPSLPGRVPAFLFKTQKLWVCRLIKPPSSRFLRCSGRKH